MRGLSLRIMEQTAARPEATPLCPAALLHLGNRAAVDQARSGKLMRICQGVYMRPIEIRFGQCAPCVDKALEALSALWGETIVPCGGAAATCLGLTTQNPVRAVLSHFRPQPSPALRLVHRRAASRPRWQLAAPHRKAGDVIRAMAWPDPEGVEDSLEAVLPTLSEEERNELSAARAIIPIWMAEPESARIAHG